MNPEYAAFKDPNKINSVMNDEQMMYDPFYRQQR